jgi:cysteine desulfurase
MGPAYLDCNATTPPEPGVAETVERFLRREYGNAASPLHDHGTVARMAVEQARGRLAALAEVRRDEVVFTSGATESNNMAILGLAPFGRRTGRLHVVSTAIEHRSVLEPLAALALDGFSVTLVPPGSGGWVEPGRVLSAVRPDTLLVSLMQVNNETGVRQPVEEVAEGLSGHDAFLHVDAAQGFGKEVGPARHPRVDLVSATAHKLYGPKGVGALLARRRGGEMPPLAPLLHGGGQEGGLRPGTLPVPLVAGFGVAADLALAAHGERSRRCAAFRERLLRALAPLSPRLNGDPDRCLPNAVNLSFPGLSSRRVVEALVPVASVSATSACTAHKEEPSHVLTAMGISGERLLGAVRFSWCHMTEEPDWEAMVAALRRAGAGLSRDGGA